MRLFLLVVASVFPLFALNADDAPLDVSSSSLKFTGHALMHDFGGEAKQFSGSAQVDPKDPLIVHGADIHISSAKLTTFLNIRDRRMLKWLKVEGNPDIEFQLNKVKLVRGNPLRFTKEMPGLFAVSGVFTLNKVGKPLKTEVMAWREGNLLIVDGKGAIDTSDHDLPLVKTLFLTVNKVVDISFHLTFDLPPSMAR